MKNNNQGRKSQVGRGTGAGALLHGRRGAAPSAGALLQWRRGAAILILSPTLVLVPIFLGILKSYKYLLIARFI